MLIFGPQAEDEAKSAATIIILNHFRATRLENFNIGPAVTTNKVHFEEFLIFGSSIEEFPYPS